MRKLICGNYFSLQSMKALAIVVAGFLPSLLHAQGFTEIQTGIQGFSETPSAAWVDFNQDGLLDIMVSGRDSTIVSGSPIRIRLFRNTGSAFVEFGTTMEPLYRSANKWLDADSDGDLDLISVGEDSSGVYQARLFSNDAVGFVNASFAPSGRRNPSVCTGDINNDGSKDLQISGLNSSGFVAADIYRNVAGQFSNTGQSVAGYRLGKSSFVDVDNDGDLDYVYTGEDDNGAEVSGLSLNQSGAFGIPTWSTPTVTRNSMAFGDFDADGDQDIAISGTHLGQLYSEILVNGGGIFTEMNSGVQDLGGWVQWGDLDNDGDLEFFEMGVDVSSYQTKIYVNNAGTFADAGVLLPGVVGQGQLGDYDNDGDLDLLVVGELFQGTSVVKLYRNDFATVVNTPPTAPTGLSYVINPDSSITFSWLAATDAQTPAAGLTYSLLIGVTPNGTEITAPPADPANGFRRLVEYGEVVTTSWTLRDISCANDYYFRVQAVDGGYMGSSFSTQLHVQLAPAGTISSDGSHLTFHSTGASVDSVVWIDSVGTHLGTGNTLPYTQTMSIGAILYSGFCSTTIAPALQIYVGITNPVAVSNIKMWPNPASSQLHITLSAPASTESVAIYDMQGRLMREQRSGFQRETLLSVEGLVPGLYLVKVTSADGQGLATGTFRKD